VDICKTPFDYPNPAYVCMTDRGGIPADLSNLVGKVYNLCRVKSYSNSRVLGHGRLEWSLSSPMSVLFSKDVFGRKRRKVPDGVLRGYCRGTMKVRSTCRVLSRKEDGHV
jgi:hypothetical protein